MTRVLLVELDEAGYSPSDVDDLVRQVQRSGEVQVAVNGGGAIFLTARVCDVVGGAL